METEPTEIDPEHLESGLTRSFLALEKIDINIYRALSENLWKPVFGRFVFGGQVVGQALVAACETVQEDQHVHSLHCYFLRGAKCIKEEGLQFDHSLMFNCTSKPCAVCLFVIYPLVCLTYSFVVDFICYVKFSVLKDSDSSHIQK
ncbi:hypothetical protein ScPMuIL_000211 [Solemya velum]